jgi:hypothetical protein
MSFELKEHQNIGPGYWKMNSSVLKDRPYRKEIEEVTQQIKDLNIDNPIDRWDMFIMVWRSITMKYTRQKAKVKNRLKNYILKQMQNLETLSCDEMTINEKKQYLYYKERFDKITEEEIKGHQIRTRGHPTYEINEPDIDFYKTLEKRFQQKTIITEIEDENGNIQAEQDKMMKTAEVFFTKLYTPSKVDLIKQQQLLKNIDRHISVQDRNKLDSPTTPKELELAVNQLKEGKSPEPFGI